MPTPNPPPKSPSRRIRRTTVVALVALLLYGGWLLGATITQSWTNNLLSDSSVASTIDDQVNQLATAVQERLKNMGAYIPNSSNAASGVLFADAQNWNGEAAVYIFDTTGSTAPDTSDPIVRFRDAEITAYRDILFNSTSTAYIDTDDDGTAEDEFVTEADKRRAFLSFNVNGENKDPPKGSDLVYVLPYGTSGASLTYTLLDAVISTDDDAGGNRTLTFASRTLTFSGASDPLITAVGSDTAIATNDPITISSGTFGVHIKNFDTTSFSSGDGIHVEVTGDEVWTVQMVFDVDYE